MLSTEIVETERRYRAIWLGGKIKLSLSNAKQYFSWDRKEVSSNFLILCTLCTYELPCAPCARKAGSWSLFFILLSQLEALCTLCTISWLLVFGYYFIFPTFPTFLRFSGFSPFLSHFPYQLLVIFPDKNHFLMYTSQKVVKSGEKEM